MHLSLRIFRSPAAVGLLLMLATIARPVFAVCLAPQTGSTPVSILVDKSAKTLSVLDAKGHSLCQFKVALGPNPEGAKTARGDGRTPEGRYTVTQLRGPRETHFHRGFYLSYPNDEDRQRAVAKGVAPGGDILIHGLKDGFGWLGAAHRLKNWTDGCIAVTNQEMDELWPLVTVGTAVIIKK